MKNPNKLIKQLSLLTGFSVSLFLLSGFFIADSLAQNLPLDLNTSTQIKDLNEKISERSSAIDNLKDEADDIQKLIEEKQQEASTLENELAMIENRVAKNRIDLKRKELEVEKGDLAIQEVKLSVEEKERTIQFQKDQLSVLIAEIYRQDQKSQLEIFLTHENLSQFFSYIKQLQELQARIHGTLTNVKEGKRQLEVYQYELELDQAEIQSLRLSLAVQKQRLDEEVARKERLIAATADTERDFQQQLSEIRFQQRLANEAIEELEAQIQEKLNQAKQLNPTFNLSQNQLLYPIPNQGITVYFHDPTYPYRHIVGEHSGLDMRTLINGVPSMGLPIRSGADGVVVKVIRNGRFTGNALYVSHGDLMTIYLHMSQLNVNLDDFVKAGQVIGLSGGAPGHPGAGLSSGPHLHFEVRQNGIPVDPCAYLVPQC